MLYLQINVVEFSVSGLSMVKGALTITASYSPESPKRVAITFKEATLVSCTGGCTVAVHAVFLCSAQACVAVIGNVCSIESHDMVVKKATLAALIVLDNVSCTYVPSYIRSTSGKQSDYSNKCKRFLKSLSGQLARNGLPLFSALSFDGHNARTIFEAGI